MKKKLTAIAATGALLGISVLTPLSSAIARPNNHFSTNILLAAKPNQNKTLLQGIPFSITENGSILAGTLSITNLTYQNGQLLASGVIQGTQTAVDGTQTAIDQPFTNIATTLTGGGSPAQCDILFLDLGPISLDLLGLTIDLSQITLDINAVRGAGNLLGNLLCALVGLLDGGGSLSSITNLLNQINGLLG